MTVLLSSTFWARAAERAVKTAGQVALLVVGQDTTGVDVFAADWINVAGFAAGGAVISLLTSLASIPVGDPSDPSLI